MTSISSPSYAIFAGGLHYSDKSSSAEIDIFNLGTFLFVTASLSSPRYDVSSGYASNNIFCFAGGFYEEKQISPIEFLNTTSGLMELFVVEMPYRHKPAIITINDVFYISGIIFYLLNANNVFTGDFSDNISPGFIPGPTVTVASSTTFSHSEISIPSGKANPCLLSVGSSIYFASTSSQVINVYDYLLSEWTLEYLPTYRTNFQCQSLNCRALYIGGLVNSFPPIASNTIDVYDAALKRWSTISVLYISSDSLVSFVLGKSLAVFSVNLNISSPIMDWISFDCPTGTRFTFF